MKQILAKGVDVSVHNSINWNRVRKTEIDFVIIRAGYGLSTEDKQFKTNIENAIKCGLDIGIYWFSYAKDSVQAVQEAKKCLSVIAPYRRYINYPVFFDWEYDSYRYIGETYGIYANKDLVSGMAISFLDTIKGAGYIPGLYTNKDYANRFFNSKAKQAGDVWIAHVKNGAGDPLPQTNYKGEYTMHQYSWVGRPSGFNSNTDMNYAYKKYGNNGTVIETPKKSTTYQVPEGIKFFTDTKKNVITIFKYSKRGNTQVSDHFKVREFASKRNNCLYSDEVKIHNKLIIILEALYKELNCSMIVVTSGYRTPQHDKDVGGSGSGQHTLGRAADIICYDKDKKIISAKKVCCTLEDMGGIYGIGYISERAVHIDTRTANKKWWGDETKPGQPNISKLGYNSFHDYFNM